ncbi:MAG: NERD domain-containing protein [Kiritimatiellae bacterium]|nr:NERD domain-containing protein [Kiritimatiellia bacterium]
MSTSTSIPPPSPYATVHGSPGARVRFFGLADIYGPFLFVVFLCGYFLHAALPLPLPRIAAAAFLAAVALAAWVASDRCARRFGMFLKGAQGEESVARELALLPAGWVVLHGVPSRARRGGQDFDHVALGAGGIFVIETKNWSGPVKVEGGCVTTGGMPVAHSPVVQARRQASELKAILDGLLPDGFPVMPVVCFASNGMDTDATDVDGTPLCNLRVLRDLLRSAPAVSPPLGAEARAKVVSALLARR